MGDVKSQTILAGHGGVTHQKPETNQRAACDVYLHAARLADIEQVNSISVYGLTTDDQPVVIEIIIDHDD